MRRFYRSLVGTDVFYRPSVRCTRLRLGRPGAAFTVNPELINSDSIVYSFGIGTDISFDEALVSRFSLQVHAFDPTPRSLEWLRTQVLPSGLHVHPYGVADIDGTTTFDPPEDPAHVSYSMMDRCCDGRVICRVQRLCTIMAMLGHQWVDVLKLDVEGSEYSVLTDMLRSNIPVGQLCVEFHHRWPQIGARKTKQAIKALHSAGYGVFDVSLSGEEYSFIKVM